MTLGRKVGIDLSDIALDGNPTPSLPKKGAVFGPCLLLPNGRPSQLLVNICQVLQWNGTGSEETNTVSTS